MKPKDVQLKDILKGGNWKYDAIIEDIPNSVKNIMDQHKIRLYPDLPNRVIWTSS